MGALAARFRLEPFPLLLCWDRPFVDLERYLPISPGLLTRPRPGPVVTVPAGAPVGFPGPVPDVVHLGPDRPRFPVPADQVGSTTAAAESRTS